jgi:chemotaxis protein CheD
LASIQYIAQGEMAIGRRTDDVISTILGSCVSACVWDPEACVGGMNHMLLPFMASGGSDMISGASEMERLINAILRIGAQRTRLRAKLFGGASMLSGRTDIGQRNALFAIEYMTREGIPVAGKSLGGEHARQIRFWPSLGDARQRVVQGQPLVRLRPVVPAASDVELF